MDNKQTINSKKGLFIFLTIIFSLAFCIIKLFNFGWLSIILFVPIFGYLVLFNISNILNATIVIKDKYDYIRFWLLSLFFLLSGLTFCDFGDVGPTSKIFKFIPDSVLVCICLFSVVITVSLSIISIRAYTIERRIMQNNDILNNQ